MIPVSNPLTKKSLKYDGRWIGLLWQVSRGPLRDGEILK